MGKEKFMNFKQAKAIVKELAKSRGFYCRLLDSMERMEEEQLIEAYKEALGMN